MLADMIPLPSEETTPPVTKMYFVSIKTIILFMDCKGKHFPDFNQYSTVNFYLLFRQNYQSESKLCSFAFRLKYKWYE
jgi:hypothetical protein